MALQKTGIIPDKFILLNVAKDTQKDQVVANLRASGTTLTEKEIEEVAT